ncbi:MAG: family 14 glycosylhydrolase [Armatimonadetes bacterium]|nr:family 14 glycosylhydrolase [Armatimonadota bacterium]
MRGLVGLMGLLSLFLCTEGAMGQNAAAGPASRGMSYTIDDILEGVLPQLDTIAADWKAMGGTSIQTYVTWETCERAGEGQWDWKAWDGAAATLKRHGLKWIPFLIVSPSYATPRWYRQGPEHAPAVCLEHGVASDIQSLWSPHIRARVDRFLRAFAERYAASGLLESVNLGIQGDYGEAIYPVSGGWTGDYHQHPGFWCGDERARADFRRWARRRYPALPGLNAAWGTAFATPEAVTYPANRTAGAAAAGSGQERRRWLDFVEWYRGAMTDLADFWLAAARRHFGRTPIYLCTGGDAPPAHGSQFAEQCRVAAKHGASIRITNEGSDYPGNFLLTRWVATAGRHYGAPFGFEPAALEDEVGAVARIFNATTSGAVQLADKHYNTVKKPSQRAVIEANLRHLFHAPRVRPPVALWYPNTALTLEGKSWTQAPDAYLLRKLTDLDYVDETLLRAGALAQHRVLVMVHGSVMEAEDARRLEGWVLRGGRLFVVNVPRLESVERSSLPEQLLFGAESKGRAVGQGRVERVASLAELAPRLRAALSEAGLPVVEQQLRGQAYAAEVEPGRWLLFNGDPAQPATARITTAGRTFEVEVPPASIVDTAGK